MSEYARIEKRTVGVYDDGSARLLDLQFELPDAALVVQRGPDPGTVQVYGLRERTGFEAVLDPALLADLAQRFEEIGS